MITITHCNCGIILWKYFNQCKNTLQWSIYLFVYMFEIMISTKVVDHSIRIQCCYSNWVSQYLGARPSMSAQHCPSSRLNRQYKKTIQSSKKSLRIPPVETPSLREITFYFRIFKSCVEVLEQSDRGEWVLIVNVTFLIVWKKQI